MNVADPDIFAKAQSIVIGENHSAPMVAFGTMKRSAAWKMYCRAANVPVDIANEVSNKLKDYELDVKHADDAEKDDVDIADYVPEEYYEYLKNSQKYMGVIDNISPQLWGCILVTVYENVVNL